MVQTRPWTAPIVVGVIAAALVVASCLYFTHPSGIVVRIHPGQQWQLHRFGPDGEDVTVLSGVGPMTSDHLRLPPGRYSFQTPEQGIPNCFNGPIYRVRPHRWTTDSSGFAAHSCAVQ